MQRCLVGFYALFIFSCSGTLNHPENQARDEGRIPLDSGDMSITPDSENRDGGGVLCTAEEHPEEGLCVPNRRNCPANKHEEKETCADNFKEVDCNDKTPKKGVTIPSKAKIIWSKGKWSDAPTCTFSCDDHWYQEGLICVQAAKPQMVVLTDISVAEPDDKESLVRLLLYSNELEILGLINNSSFFGHNRIHPELIHDVIDGYAEVRPQLLKHAKGFPSVAYLRSIVKKGQSQFSMDGVGKGKESAGSRHIVDLLKNKEGPIWFQGWGGLNTLAQSLFTLRQNESPTKLKELLKKIKVYDMAGQDYGGAWIAHNFPTIFYIRSLNYKGFSGLQDNVKGGDFSAFNKAWYQKNVQKNHGALGAKYPNHKYSAEADSPTFMFLLNVGLNPDKIRYYGGWGGRFQRSKTKNQPSVRESNGEKQYRDWFMYGDARDEWASDAPEYVDAAGNNAPIYAAVFRWKRHYQNDFEARMDWCVFEPDKANHPPIAKVLGSLKREVEPGERVILDASGSKDPDGDSISYHWYNYKSAGTMGRPFSIQNNTAQKASFEVPENANVGEEIHIILTVKDTGAPFLVRYRRIVLTIKTKTPSNEGKRFEAEDATLQGAIVADNYKGFSGKGFVDFVNLEDDYIEWKISRAQAGSVQGSFGYALEKGNRPLEVRVNGDVVNANLDFPETGSFTHWLTTSLELKLKKGTNKIRITVKGKSGANIDYLSIQDK